jgi:tol-pal system protein YbgF
MIALRLSTLALFTMIAFAPGMASAQNINSIELRLDRMEREMQTLSRSVFKGDIPPPQIGRNVSAQETAAMELRLNQIEESIRRLTGQIEEQGFEIRQLKQAIENSAVRTQSNTSSISSSQTIEARPLEPVTPSQPQQPYQLGTINNGGTPNSPAGQYDQAFSYLQTNDYASAEKAFRDFIDQYPDHSLAANSKYWLGETFYARENYEAAARAFATSFQDHPEGQKAPDTLLKLAMSLGNQGMKEEACLTLTELKNRFPNGPASVMSKADDERQSYGCDS